jgi:hypothetical protein
VNNDHAVTAIKDRLAEVRDSLGHAHPSIPASEIIARARSRRVRRRLIPAITAALVLAAGAAVAVTALLPASHPASHQPRVQLAAWKVTRQPGGVISVSLRELRDPAGLQATLRADGVPASVTFYAGHPYPPPPCRVYLPMGLVPTPAEYAVHYKVFENPPYQGPGIGINIRPSALPAGTGVYLIGAFSPTPARPTGLSSGLVYASPQCTGS